MGNGTLIYVDDAKIRSTTHIPKKRYKAKKYVFTNRRKPTKKKKKH